MSNDSASTNVARLKEAGLIRQPLPDAHQRVIDGLDPEHVDLLIEIKKQLEAADEEMQLKGSPAFTSYIIY